MQRAEKERRRLRVNGRTEAGVIDKQGCGMKQRRAMQDEAKRWDEGEVVGGLVKRWRSGGRK